VPAGLLAIFRRPFGKVGKVQVQSNELFTDTASDGSARTGLLAAAWHERRRRTN
jgi:hypothetical protein